MNVRVLVLAIGGAMLAVAALVFVLVRPDAPAEPAAPAVSAPPPPPPAPEPAPEPESPRVSAPAPAPPRAPAAASAPAAAPTRATLRIETDVPGAIVFLDRQFVGNAPVTIEDVEPGRRQLNVSAEGFEGVARTLDVEPGPLDVRINFREVRLNVSAAVEHRHRFGSCRGRLVADARGLRYETDHEDAFSASLDDLEAFEIDYIENNLRVRIRGGRQYNFTDPEGNADTIFAFHRDVERARQRIAAGDTLVTD